MLTRKIFVLSLPIVHSLITNGKIITIEESQNQHLSKCVQRIIVRYFNGGPFNYINLDEADDDDQVINMLHAMKVPVATVKWPYSSENVIKAYFIYVRNEYLFDHANYLIQEKFWDPNVRFIVIVKHLKAYNLRKVFDILLNLRVHNVVVVNGTDSAELYSYNAFENNACGNYYTDTISYGKCYQGFTKLYRNKKSLRGCFLRVSMAHTPPFIIDPSVIKEAVYVAGIEQYIIQLISKVEHFTYNFSYDFNSEDYSKVSNNMSVTGPLELLKNNDTDMLVGGRFLLRDRALKFSFIHAYMDYEDHINKVVKKATVLPAWTDFYQGFSCVVWLLALLLFIAFSSLLILIFKPKDKFHIIMILLDNLLQHGSLFKHLRHVKLFLIIWVWFSYLLNCFYTSTLVSLINKPITGFQVRTDKELQLLGIKPCLCPLMLGYFVELSLMTPSASEMVDNKHCRTIMDSLYFVRDSYTFYTAVPNMLFAYNDHLLKDEYGQLSVSFLEKSHSNLMYAFYVNKGFPLVEKIMIWGLRLRQTGLYKKHMDDIVFWRQLRYNKYRVKEFKSRVAVPWLVYIVGIILSLVAFLFETTLKCRSR